jgi:hypothetical protein
VRKSRGTRKNFCISHAWRFVLFQNTEPDRSSSHRNGAHAKDLGVLRPDNGPRSTGCFKALFKPF